MNPSERTVLVASEAGISVSSLEDIPELLGQSYGFEGLLLTEGELGPEFFDLRSGLAGELFQKCTNYRLKLALVLPDPGAHGERFAELAFEHRAHRLIRFFGRLEEAWAWLER